MWEAQNMYNSPAAQMSRLQEAGLNPHLVYGSGNVAGNNAGQVPRYNPPTEDYSTRQSVIGASLAPVAASIQQYQDMTMRQAQIDNVQASTQRVEAETANAIIRGEYLGLERSYREESGRLGMLKAEQEVEALMRRNELSKTQTQSIAADIPLKEKELVLRQLRAEWQQYRNKWEKAGLTVQGAAWYKAAISVMDSLDIDSGWLIKEWNLHVE